MSRKLDWRKLPKNAEAFIKAEQKVSFDLLAKKFNLGMASVVKLLGRLEKKGLVKRGKQRRWLVLVNPDGSKKEGVEIPKRRWKRRKLRKASSTKQVAATKRQLSKPNGRFTANQKVSLLDKLMTRAGPRSKALLRAIAEDVRLRSSSPMDDVLKD